MTIALSEVNRSDVIDSSLVEGWIVFRVDVTPFITMSELIDFPNLARGEDLQQVGWFTKPTKYDL